MLEVTDLACLRGDRMLFADVALTVAAGELVRIAGPNGVGKTSLLRLLCGLAVPEHGAVRWKGERIDHNRDAFHRELLYLGHLDEIDGWCDLPTSSKTVPQAMFERRAWSERVLHDVMGLSRHLMEVLIDLDAAAFTDEPGAPELVGHVPTRADLAALDQRLRREGAQKSG